MSMSNNKAGHDDSPPLPRAGESVPSSHDQKPSGQPDGETMKMLQEAGLDSSMIDPSSLKALQDICTPKHRHGKSVKVMDDGKCPATPSLKSQTTSEETKGNDGLSAHVPSEVLRPLPMARVTSDLTMGLRSESMVEEQTDASTAGSTARVGSVMDKRILDQLQLQTDLKLDLQRRVDELSRIVAQQQQQQQQQQQAGIPPSGDMRQMTNQGGNIPPPPVQQPQQQPRNIPQPPPQQHEMLVFQLFNSLIANIRSARIAEICRVYWALHRRDVGGRLDGNLILKVAVMAVILLSKFSSSTKRNKNKGDRESIKSTLQFYVMVLLIVGGFAIQSGYARFLYNFVVKERYPQRIWNGEVIDVAAQQPPQRNNNAERRRRGAQQEQDAPPDDGPGLLRGGIREAPAQAGVVGKFVMDVVYLFGSFLLSILPMWKAEAQPRGERQEGANQRANGQQENEGGRAEGDNENMD